MPVMRMKKQRSVKMKSMGHSSHYVCLFSALVVYYHSEGFKVCLESYWNNSSSTTI